jgi:hypothetical protein
MSSVYPILAAVLGALSALSLRLSDRIVTSSRSLEIGAQWLHWALLLCSTRLYSWYSKEEAGGREPDGATADFPLNVLTMAIIVAELSQRAFDASWILVRTSPRLQWPLKTDSYGA